MQLHHDNCIRPQIRHDNQPPNANAPPAAKAKKEPAPSAGHQHSPSCQTRHPPSPQAPPTTTPTLQMWSLAKTFNSFGCAGKIMRAKIHAGTIPRWSFRSFPPFRATPTSKPPSPTKQGEPFEVAGESCRSNRSGSAADVEKSKTSWQKSKKKARMWFVIE
ncbi:hypothetical protein COCSADRAFT_329602 [Bipolaris sorokiniana ND90Pr]|uniref:Uncharacterized protein n=1 Tax=Cochliobolus sativus (strain ND90Pr / ATCC 201652) TaxID=665912 RepID=M2T3P3_COCSN|nr:uncharacterized protein COCSADRAFT_329602 [Bipolaris sorokiniana ND90Pr]EMD63602.1 hypothetical protein COCSADRAFT_329602 [Bipolaris sorokiniana ND90Pr]